MRRKHDWSVTFAGRGADMTFTYKHGGIRRVLTIDTRAVPEGRYEAQQWFLILLGRIWWDIAEPESFAVTTRVADEMVTGLLRCREVAA